MTSTRRHQLVVFATCAALASPSGCLFLVNEAGGEGGNGTTTTSETTGTGSGGAGAQGAGGVGGSLAQGGGGGAQPSLCSATLANAGLSIASGSVSQLVMGPPASIDTFAMTSGLQVTGWQASVLDKSEITAGANLLSARLAAGGTSGAVIVYKITSDGPDRVATIASDDTDLILTNAYDAPGGVPIAQATAVDGHVYGIVGSAREIHRFTSTSTSSPVEQPAPSDALHLVAFETSAAGLVWYSDAPSRVSRCWVDSNGDCTDTVDRDVPTASVKGLLYDPESDRAVLVIGSNPPTLHVVSFGAGASGAVTTPELTGAVHFTLAGGHLIAASPTGLVACCLDQLTEAEACGDPTARSDIDLLAGTPGAARFVLHDAENNVLDAYDVSE